MSSLRSVLFVALMALCGSADAQYAVGDYYYTCPNGAPWNDPRCIREPLTSNDAPSNVERPRQPSWTSLIPDKKSRRVAYAEGRMSKEQAENDALTACQAIPGSSCGEPFTFYGTCAALARPKMGYKGFFEGFTGLNQSTNKESAMRECGGEKCEIVYSGCTPWY